MANKEKQKIDLPKIIYGYYEDEGDYMIGEKNIKDCALLSIGERRVVGKYQLVGVYEVWDDRVFKKVPIGGK